MLFQSAGCVENISKTTKAKLKNLPSNVLYFMPRIDMKWFKRILILIFVMWKGILYFLTLYVV